MSVISGSFRNIKLEESLGFQNKGNPQFPNLNENYIVNVLFIINMSFKRKNRTVGQKIILFQSLCQLYKAAYY